MPEYNERSEARLKECHEDLQMIFYEVIKYFDCSIICGQRGEKEQNEAFEMGLSQLKYPKSNHNKSPSLAVDAVPYPVEWNNINRMRLFAGFVLGIASQLKANGFIDHDIRWGGDWDRDTFMKDQRFHDVAHFELIKK